jgi:polyhydroxybutyrate depolymerase
MSTISRRTMLALAAGIGAAALSGCRGARANAESAPGAGRATGGRAAPTLVTARAARAGRSVQQIDVAGVSRSYVRYEPAGLDATAPVPLVILLHGRGGSGAIAERAYEMSRQAEAHGFVVAYPDALGDPPSWNAGLGGVDRSVDDVGFMRALVAREADARPIDPRRTFVCGHSSGGIMSYRLAGEASDLFPAVGVVAGAIGYRLPNGSLLTIPTPDRPVAVIHFHGTDDPLVPYNGGTRRGPAGFVSVADSVAFWVARNGCDPTPIEEAIGSSRRQTYGGGRDGSEVTLWTSEGGGHGWPKVDGRQNVAVSPAGISATELIWSFFEQHPRAGQQAGV